MILYSMELIRKGNTAILSCIRNTSCSRGWLRLLMQMIFGTIIVSSFILIVLMALDNSSNQLPEQQERCVIEQCRIVCHKTPYFGEFENQIMNSVSIADAICDNVALELHTPKFKDSILPEFWLSRMRSTVHELSIIGGNINYIAPQAFLSHFGNNLNILILEKLMLVSWESKTLLGLSNLNKLYIKECTIEGIKSNALKPVDDTLKFLDIKAKNLWNPRNITGCSGDLELIEVDFSFNNFYDILNDTSFTKLSKCKVLYLNSCKITTIAKGAFDHLRSIEVLYLSNNYLVTIPENLFEAILPYRPRLALQENFWYCNCFNVHLRAIQNSGLLIVEPLCYYPDEMRGVTFSDFEEFCSNTKNNDSDDRSETSAQIQNISFRLYSNGICSGNNLTIYNSNRFRIISPSENHKCKFNRMMDVDLSVTAEKSHPIVSTAKTWITPVFWVEQNPYTMLEMEAYEQPGVGLIWYQSSCFTEVYCVKRIPNVLKVFNVHSGSQYTFCPFNITSGMILQSECVFYDLGLFGKKVSFDILIYLCISLGCITFGAVCVYAVIFKNPSLLKANKRVLFVKHKSIEALIMPPTVPSRKNLIHESDNLVKRFIEKQKIFVLPDLGITTNFIRSTSSTRSVVSNDGSYISALQPTEEQLNEWRANQIINQCDSRTCTDFDTPFSSFYDTESFPYYTLHTSQKLYEVPKEY